MSYLCIVNMLPCGDGDQRCHFMEFGEVEIEKVRAAVALSGIADMWSDTLILCTGAIIHGRSTLEKKRANLNGCLKAK